MPEPDSPLPVPSWRERIDLLLAGEGPSIGQLLAAAVALVAVIVGAVLWVRAEPPPPDDSLPRASAPSGPASTEPSELYVQAAGAVRRPGVYRLGAGARVIDLLDAAGGPAPGAAPDLLNLAARLADGERVYVPRNGETVPPPPAGSSPSSAGSGDAIVDLNQATAEQLEELPGIGPATAAAIIEHRERHGPFRTVDDLLDVRGIGDARLADLRDQVRV